MKGYYEVRCPECDAPIAFSISGVAVGETAYKVVQCNQGPRACGLRFVVSIEIAVWLGTHIIEEPALRRQRVEYGG